MTKTFFSKRSDMFHYAASADYNGDCIRSANSSVCDGEVYSYSTLVAKFNKKTEKMIYSGHYYSHTTSTTMWELRRAFDHYRKLMVYDFTLDNAVDRLKRELEIHTKSPATRRDGKEHFINSVYSLENLIEYYDNGKKYLNMSFYKKAKAIADKYYEEIVAKDKRAEERRANKVAKSEQERRERLARTRAICEEYDKNFVAEPKTFKECMTRRSIRIPFEWLKERHPECIYDYGSQIRVKATNFERAYDFQKGDWSDYAVFRTYDSNYKILRNICRYGGTAIYTPDVLVYNSEEKLLKTSQGCEVDDTAGHVKTLLGLFLKAVDEGRDTSFVIGKHCGPYEIREWNDSEKFLRVGCHCFLLENLREVYQDMMSAEEDKNKTCWNNYIQMKGV